MELYDLMKKIADSIPVDVVNRKGEIIYTVKQGERCGSKYFDFIRDKEVRYILPVNHKKLEIGVE